MLRIVMLLMHTLVCATAFFFTQKFRFITTVILRGLQKCSIEQVHKIISVHSSFFHNSCFKTTFSTFPENVYLHLKKEENFLPFSNWF